MSDLRLSATSLCVQCLHEFLCGRTDNVGKVPRSHFFPPPSPRQREPYLDYCLNTATSSTLSDNIDTCFFILHHIGNRFVLWSFIQHIIGVQSLLSSKYNQIKIHDNAKDTTALAPLHSTHPRRERCAHMRAQQAAVESTTLRASQGCPSPQSNRERRSSKALLVCSSVQGEPSGGRWRRAMYSSTLVQRTAARKQHSDARKENGCET